MSKSKTTTSNSMRISGAAREKIEKAFKEFNTSRTKALDQLLLQGEMLKRLAASAKKGDITGRDNFIITKALLYAVGVIQFLPEERQEFSDMCDMLAILKATTQGEWLAHMAAGVIGHTTMPIDFAADVEAEGEAA